jgi:hypothetical protein
LSAIVDALPEIYLEMRQQQKLRKFGFFQFLMENDLRIQYIEFALAVAINIIMLATYHYDESQGDRSIEHKHTTHYPPLPPSQGETVSPVPGFFLGL